MDKDTEKPLDILTPQAQQMIKTLGSHNTRISEIIAQEDRAVFTAIQKGVDRVNERATSQAQKVGTPCNLQTGHCWTIKTQYASTSVFTCVILSIFQVKIDHLAYFVNIFDIIAPSVNTFIDKHKWYFYLLNLPYCSKVTGI